MWTQSQTSVEVELHSELKITWNIKSVDIVLTCAVFDVESHAGNYVVLTIIDSSAATFLRDDWKDRSAPVHSASRLQRTMDPPTSPRRAARTRVAVTNADETRKFVRPLTSVGESIRKLASRRDEPTAQRNPEASADGHKGTDTQTHGQTDGRTDGMSTN
jgi:hypothetical protein